MTRAYMSDDTQKRFEERGNSLLNKFSPKNLSGLFGRKQDVESISGEQSTVGKAKKDPLFSSVSSGKVMPLRTGDTVTDVTAKLYNLLKATYDRKVKNREIESIFQEHTERERERRHQELLKVLSGYKPNGYKPKKGKKEETAEPTEKTPSIIQNVFENITSRAATSVAGAAARTLLPMAGIAGVAFLGALPYLLDENGKKGNPNETGDYTLTKPITEMTAQEKWTGRVGAKRESILEMVEASKDAKAPVFTEAEAADIKKFYDIDVPKETVGDKKKITTFTEPGKETAKVNGRALADFLEEKWKNFRMSSTSKAETGSIAPEVPVVDILPAKVQQVETPTPQSAKLSAATTEMQDLELAGMSGGSYSQNTTKNNTIAGDAKKGGTLSGNPSVRNSDETFRKTQRTSTKTV